MEIKRNLYLQKLVSFNGILNIGILDFLLDNEII